MHFPTTRWTLIAEATLHGQAGGRSAMEDFCRNYYEPVRRFIEWSGRGSDDAADLTQAFFLHVCEKGLVQRADRLKGKFRTFIIAVLKNFLSHADRAATTQKRGGDAMLLEIDDAAEVPSEESDVRFDREWALPLMDMALTNVGEEIRASRGEAALQTLRLFLSGQQSAPTYETAGQMMGMTSAAVKVEVMRLRRRLGELIRAEIGRTVSAPHEIDEEMAYLRQVLAA